MDEQQKEWVNSDVKERRDLDLTLNLPKKMNVSFPIRRRDKEIVLSWLPVEMGEVSCFE